MTAPSDFNHRLLILGRADPLLPDEFGGGRRARGGDGGNAAGSRPIPARNQIVLVTVPVTSAI